METNSDNIILVNNIIDDAIRQKASDIHIEPFKDELRIRFRIDGSLSLYKTYSMDLHSKILARIKVMSSLDIAEKRLAQDGRITYRYKDKDVDLRISIINTIYGQKCVIRVLNPDNFIVGMDKLGISDEEIDLISEYTKFENGLILVCGPTGSGKTTSLYTMIIEENDIEKNIITIENPVEYNIYGINQIQINEKIGMRFDNTLKYVLRQDPDIILLGEIRDSETAKLAMRSSITGHKVFSTLHTDDVYQSIIRLLDMGVEDYMIRASLKLVISQRLVKKLCPYCKEKVEVDKSYREIFDKYKIDPPYIYRPKGCEHCNNGYSGRMALMQILKVDEDIRREITSTLDIERLEKIGKSKNIKSLFEKALFQVSLGNTSMKEALRLLNE
ncbi:MAG: GspE/PulE family protein [Finegoldia sp.]|nr:GspE/PulE family protein [Finegoldia sp.]